MVDDSYKDMKSNDDLVKETAPDFHYTYKDYLKWDEGKRCELINGQVYMMAPAPSPEHQKVSGEIFRQIANFLLDKECNVFDAPLDVILTSENKPDDSTNVVQPDIVVICDKNKIDNRACNGTPDLIVEIISPSTENRDRKIKKSLYEKYGVREYWLVDYIDKTVEVCLLSDNNKYLDSTIYSQNDKVPLSIFDNLYIDLLYVFRD